MTLLRTCTVEVYILIDFYLVYGVRTVTLWHGTPSKTIVTLSLAFPINRPVIVTKVPPLTGPLDG